eukprot:g44530.t1
MFEGVQHMWLVPKDVAWQLGAWCPTYRLFEASSKLKYLVPTLTSSQEFSMSTSGGWQGLTGLELGSPFVTKARISQTPKRSAHKVAGLDNDSVDNPKAFYTHIRCKRVAREEVGPLMDKGENLCVEPQEVGDIVDEDVASVFTKEKDVDDGKISEGFVDIRGHVDIKMEEVLLILKNIKEVTNMIDEDRAVDVVCMDLTKAFDIAPHGQLVQKF